jgi:hypothetical protein
MSAGRRAAVAAEFVHFSHVMFSGFVFLGSGLVLLDTRVALVHVPAVFWIGLVTIAGLTCPLTPLERKLRNSAGRGQFSGGWIRRYIAPLVSWDGSPRRLERSIGVAALAWNALLYGGLLWWTGLADVG